MPVLLCNLSSALLATADDEPFRRLLDDPDSAALCGRVDHSTQPWDLVDDAFRAFQTGHLGESEYARHLRCRLGWRGDDPQLVALFEENPHTVHLGALEALRTVQAAGWTLVGLENANPWQIRARCRVYDALELGSRRFIGSLGIRVRLPDVRVFHFACVHLGVSTSSALYVDRDPANIASARSAGLRAHLLRGARDLRRATEEFEHGPVATTG